VCIWNYDKSINIKSKQVLLSSKNQQKKNDGWWIFLKKNKKNQQKLKIETSPKHAFL